MNRAYGFILCNLMLTACIIAGGCASSTGTILSDAHQRAATLLNRGLRAAEKQEFQEAERLLTSALNVSNSIEDNPAKIVTLINLTRLYRLNNNPEKAEENIAKALAIQSDDRSVIAERYHEKALLELLLHKPTAALAAARASFNAEEGIYKGKRRNLISRSLYESGDTKEALAEAMIALIENRSAGVHEEEANSLRMAGIITREEKRYEESGLFLAQALQLDKQLGLGSKITRDLEELARTAEQRGFIDQAIHYLERAFETCNARGELFKANALKDQIHIIQKKSLP